MFAFSLSLPPSVIMLRIAVFITCDDINVGFIHLDGKLDRRVKFFIVLVLSDPARRAGERSSSSIGLFEDEDDDEDDV